MPVRRLPDKSKSPVLLFPLAETTVVEVAMSGSPGPFVLDDKQRHTLLFIVLFDLAPHPTIVEVGTFLHTFLPAQFFHGGLFHVVPIQDKANLASLPKHRLEVK